MTHYFWLAGDYAHAREYGQRALALAVASGETAIQALQEGTCDKTPFAFSPRIRISVSTFGTGTSTIQLPAKPF